MVIPNMGPMRSGIMGISSLSCLNFCRDDIIVREGRYYHTGRMIISYGDMLFFEHQMDVKIHKNDLK